MSKQFFFFGFFVLMITNTFSQDRRVENIPTFDDRKLHYGFYLGVNQNDFKINLRRNTIDAEIQSEPTMGFNVGLIADYRLHKNLNLRFEPGLVSNSKTINFNHISDETKSIREIGSTYLHVPLILKFSTHRIGNVKPYLLGGISYDYNFSSNEGNQDDNFAGEFRMKTSNFMYEVGIGMDFYLSYFKFSPSIRGVFALNNEIKYDNPASGSSQWTDPVNYFGTRGVFLNFAFE